MGHHAVQKKKKTFMSHTLTQHTLPAGGLSIYIINDDFDVSL